MKKTLDKTGSVENRTPLDDGEEIGYRPNQSMPQATQLNADLVAVNPEAQERFESFLDLVWGSK